MTTEIKEELKVPEAPEKLVEGTPLEGELPKPPEGGQPQTVSQETYQAAQKTISKFDRRVKELEATVATVGNIKSTLDDLLVTNQFLVERLTQKEEELFEEPMAKPSNPKEELAKRLEENRTKRQTEDKVNQETATEQAAIGQEIVELLQDNGIPGEDPRLEKVNRLWVQDQNYKGALLEANRIVNAIRKTQKTDIEAEVQRRVQEERKKKQKIDVGVPSAPESNWSNLPAIEKIKRGLTKED